MANTIYSIDWDQHINVTIKKDAPYTTVIRHEKEKLLPYASKSNVRLLAGFFRWILSIKQTTSDITWKDAPVKLCSHGDMTIPWFWFYLNGPGHDWLN